jgi:hypothetical protein
MRKALAALTLLFLFSGCCMTRIVVYETNPIPPNLLLKAMKFSSGQTSGMATPISPRVILTMAHVMEDSAGTYQYVTGLSVAGTCQRMLFDPKKDTASCMTEVSLDRVFQKATSLPKSGDPVYWLASTDGITYMVVRGYYLGEDNGKLLIDGWSRPGSSGSPILNQKGLLIGLIHGGRSYTGFPTERAISVGIPIMEYN